MYKVVFVNGFMETELDDEIFNTEEEAREWRNYNVEVNRIENLLFKEHIKELKIKRIGE